MPLSGTGPALGTELATASGGFLPPAVTAWTGVANAIMSWAPGGILVLSVNTTIPANSLVAAGAVVTGSGALQTTDLDSLGQAMASGAGVPSTDAKGIAKWVSVAHALGDWIADHGGLDPTNLVASPSGGVLTGTATVVFDDKSVGPRLAEASGTQDPIGRAGWNSIGTTILSHIETFANVLPGAIASPNGGGPCAGLGVLS